MLVEGRDDLFAITGLLDRHGLSWPNEQAFPFINDTVLGKDELLKQLPLVLKGSFQRLGVVLDADLDVSSRWAEVVRRLRDAGYHPPNQPDPGGTIIERSGKGIGPSRVGVWLMPNNQDPGELEDFLAELVPADDAVWPHAETATQEAVRLGAPCGQAQLSKAWIRCWLAWQKQPGLPFGTALTAQVLGHDGPLATAFVKWFSELFLMG